MQDITARGKQTRKAVRNDYMGIRRMADHDHDKDSSCSPEDCPELESQGPCQSVCPFSPASHQVSELVPLYEETHPVQTQLDTLDV